jgi:hypothetical protein
MGRSMLRPYKGNCKRLRRPPQKAAATKVKGTDLKTRRYNGEYNGERNNAR